MKRGSEPPISLYGDHLGSSSVATRDNSSEPKWQTYYPYGAVRTSDGLPTDYAFTGQRLDSYINLIEMGARWYEPALGRFIQPDSIIPDPFNPQSLNRYSYVLDNPMRYTDPSGFHPQHPGDPDDDTPDDFCETDWCWQNRWYAAHGYNWDNNKSDWVMPNTPNSRFYDEAITDAALAEGGVTLHSAIWSPWSRDQKQVVAKGLSMFGAKLINEGGIPYLARLLGGSVAMYLMPWGDPCPYACAPPPPLSSGRVVNVSSGMLSSPTGYQDVVHELAHVIDWHSSIGGRGFSAAWHGAPLTQYAIDGTFQPAERFAEAVSTWVFYDSKSGTSTYRNALLSIPTGALTAQMDRMEALLKGWY